MESVYRVIVKDALYNLNLCTNLKNCTKPEKLGINFVVSKGTLLVYFNIGIGYFMDLEINTCIFLNFLNIKLNVKEKAT